jgi:hypothetical protein
LTWMCTVLRMMTIDAPPRRMPGAVLTAVILLVFFGGIGGLVPLALGAVGLLSEGALYGDAALPFALLGVLILAMTVLGAIGLAKGNRGAQIVAVSLGAILLLAGLAGMRTNPAGALVGLAAGGALVLLVVAPVSSRDWFSR